MIIVYPDKLEDIFSQDNFDYNSVCNCVRVKNNSEEYTHKIYLGGIMKLGIKREKIGDIIVYNEGADIIVSKDVTKFLLSNLQQLTRWLKKVYHIKLEKIH